MSAAQDHALAEQFESQHNVETVDDLAELGAAEECDIDSCYFITVE